MHYSSVYMASIASAELKKIFGLKRGLLNFFTILEKGVLCHIRFF